MPMVEPPTPTPPEGGAAELDALLATKLHVPRTRRGLVPRPRLVGRLTQGLEGELTLVCAPAGFGKTALLADWTRRRGRAVAWLSLDAGDNDPARFWRHAAAALGGVREEVGKQLAPLLRPPPRSFESVVTALVNDLAAVPGELVLVLDDYHLIESQAVHESLVFLLEHLPAGLRLVVASRADPPLPLGRLRARGQLVEVRAAELRFTSGEAATLLREAVRPEFPEDAVAALTARTEGWVAGLQLAALSLQGHADPAGFVAAFSGSHRYVLDYLAEEVLERQPEQLHGFLLETSVLDRLCGPLCDAVTGRPDGQRLLEAIERANLFLVPLDEVRGWYRYHQLFADLLRVRLAQERPERVPALHRAAAGWCEERGLVDDAIRHALAAGDATWAARLVERNIGPMLGHGETTRWLAALPAELVRSRPRLCVGAGQPGDHDRPSRRARAMAGRRGAGPCRRRRRRADRRTTGLGRLGGGLAGGRARDGGDPAGRPRPPTWRRRPRHPARAGGLGPATHRGPYPAVSRRLEPGPGSLAQRRPRRGRTRACRAGRRGPGGRRTLPDPGHLLGPWPGAARPGPAGRRAVHLSAGPDRRCRDGEPLGIAHVGVAAVLCEQNELDGAFDHATEGVARCRQLAGTRLLAEGLVVLARIRQALGDRAGALAAIGEAERVGPTPDVVDLFNPAAAERAQLLLAQGQVADVASWAAARGLGADDQPSYQREREHLLLARVLLAQSEAERARRLLDRMHAAAAAHGRAGSLVELQAVEAVALAACGEQARALAVLADALTLAWPEGYVRVFVDEGAPLAVLLDQLVASQRGGRVAPAPGVPREYLHRLRAALAPRANRAAPPATRPDASAVAPGPTEPLTGRELEVLALVAAGTANQQIADELVVALETVKKHVSHILGKLGAANRTQAVARARELGLLR
jgi:LuxR family maltose regulon positive regulatory protein